MYKSIMKELFRFYMNNATAIKLLYPKTTKMYKILERIVLPSTALTIIIILVILSIVNIKLIDRYIIFLLIPFFILLVAMLYSQLTFSKIKKDFFKNEQGYHNEQMAVLKKYLKKNNLYNSFTILMMINYIHDNKATYNIVSIALSKSYSFFSSIILSIILFILGVLFGYIQNIEQVKNILFLAGAIIFSIFILIYFILSIIYPFSTNSLYSKEIKDNLMLTIVEMNKKKNS